MYRRPYACTHTTAPSLHRYKALYHRIRCRAWILIAPHCLKPSSLIASILASRHALLFISGIITVLSKSKCFSVSCLNQSQSSGVTSSSSTSEEVSEGVLNALFSRPTNLNAAIMFCSGAASLAPSLPVIAALSLNRSSNEPPRPPTTISCFLSVSWSTRPARFFNLDASAASSRCCFSSFSLSGSTNTGNFVNATSVNACRNCTLVILPPRSNVPSFFLNCLRMARSTCATRMGSCMPGINS
mmetsp:Transcript_20860/g.54339  ORF Transcript_20860/g.54339 Transcript_20860/m.54339 type:complete len:243 (-) Transcript_20860:2524-3252(-)